MAKTEGTQSVPSALLDIYRATLGEQRPNLAVHKRVPFHLPPMQEGGKNVTAKQRAQRDRFKTAIVDFATKTPAEKAHWYAAMPEWSSLLWYYNYYIMSDLTGNVNIDQGGAGVIKSLQYKTISMPAGTGEGSVAITAVDIAKTVVMLFGASAVIYELEFGSVVITAYPYVSSMASELVKCKWSIPSWGGQNALAATISIIVIEYI